MPAAKRTKTLTKPTRKAAVPLQRVRLDVDERRAQLVKLSMEAFSTRAYDDVSIDDLAKDAGISKGLLYHYFPTKRDFYVAGLREGARDLLERTHTPPTMEPMERMNVGLGTYLDYVQAHAPAYAALLRGGVGNDPEVAKIVDETRAVFVERFFEGLPFVKPTALVRAAVKAWVGFVEHASLAWVDDPAVSREQLKVVMIEVMLHAVKTAAAVGER